VRYGRTFRKLFGALSFRPDQKLQTPLFTTIRAPKSRPESCAAPTIVPASPLLIGALESKLPRMKMMWERAGEAGKAGWAFLWLIGVPIPVLLILFLMRGCT
jgi:hypothetical protein